MRVNYKFGQKNLGPICAMCSRPAKILCPRGKFERFTKNRPKNKNKKPTRVGNSKNMI